MDLEQQLTSAMRRMCADMSEAQVKQSVVLPILRALGWNTEDSKGEVCPEYGVGKGKKVDYALMRYDQPQVFIEAKKIGKAEDEDSQEQLFGYARDNGIPILVLTDGKLWKFYFGTGAGAWKDRCYCQLTLDDEESVFICADFLRAHLGKKSVESGDAHRRADERLRQIRAAEHAKRKLPEVWRKLLSEPHPQLCDLLREHVRTGWDVEPRTEDINSFLKDQAVRESVPMVSTPAAEIQAQVPKSHVGLKTPQSEFRRPILQVLIEMGGRGERRQVLNRLAEVMASRLGDHDRETHKDGTIRWEKTAEFQCTEMRKIGLLKPVSTKGVWEVSDRGRRFWSEQR